MSFKNLVTHLNKPTVKLDHERVNFTACALKNHQTFFGLTRMYSEKSSVVRPLQALSRPSDIVGLFIFIGTDA